MAFLPPIIVQGVEKLTGLKIVVTSRETELAARWNDRAAIVVATNRNQSQDAQIRLQIPRAEIGLAGHTSYTVSNLWPGGDGRTLTEKGVSIPRQIRGL